MAEETTEESGSFTEALLGKQILLSGPVQKFMAWPLSWRIVSAVSVLAGALLLPYLGAVGLWDCWEPHYGEVARMMVQRNDYVRPYWESTWFFSKPPLTMWMEVPGLLLTGASHAAGELSRMTEWAMRLPFALMAVATLVLLAYAVSRTANVRAGLASAFALATMPLYFLLARQTVTDTPFVCTQVAAISCALIGLFDEETRHRSGWWYAFYILLGLGTLAKELVAIAIPAAVLLTYAGFCVFPWTPEGLSEHWEWLTSSERRAQVRSGSRPMPALWDQMYKMKLGTGILVFFAIAGPWLLTMLALNPGLDDENERFWFRYFMHDQINRLTVGVHTTTPFTNFVYFIEQAGYAIFPWVALLPGALAYATRIRLRELTRETRVAVIAVLWGLLSFLVFGASATKFHHYVFPLLPPLAVLMGLFIERLWREGVHRHAVSLMMGFVLFVLVAKDLTVLPMIRDPEFAGQNLAPGEKLHGGMKVFTDLFVYNYDRPYPLKLLTAPLSLFGPKPLTSGDFFAVILIAVGAYLFFESLGKGPSALVGRAMGVAVAALGLVPPAAEWTQRSQVPPTLLAGGALLVGAAFALVAALTQAEPDREGLFAAAGALGLLGGLLGAVGGVSLSRGTPIAQDPVAMVIGQEMNLRSALGFAMTVAAVLWLLSALWRSRLMLFGCYAGFAVAFAVWFSYSHWVDLSHHWTQRDLFWRYYEKRHPGEPIAAFLMNWRGETFYSHNTVKQIRDNNKMTEYINLPGRKWSLVEQGPRTNILRQLAGSHPFTVYEPSLNAKFVLVSID